MWSQHVDLGSANTSVRMEFTPPKLASIGNSTWIMAVPVLDRTSSNSPLQIHAAVSTGPTAFLHDDNFLTPNPWRSCSPYLSKYLCFVTACLLTFFLLHSFHLFFSHCHLFDFLEPMLLHNFSL